ncbi:hypothetical protein KSP39_PZI010245 [Platanthera zijinensis]|uniref:EF-hand domain-containing protein n=1 Tax=Platanthera zijinensis TaxID=2320716 RepID=A0AAP0G6W4_9ASPA
MAIKHVRSSEAGMTVEEFKDWLMRFDDDCDGRISKDELRKAIRSIGVRFSWWKSRRGIRLSDSNNDGLLDDGEIDNLVSFMQKDLGLKITAKN